MTDEQPAQTETKENLYTTQRFLKSNIALIKAKKEGKESVEDIVMRLIKDKL